MIAMRNQPRDDLQSVSYLGYLALGFGTIVGMGWILYSGSWLESGGPLGAALAFLIGGLAVIPVGLSYAELTAALPVSGGDVAFVRVALGVRGSYVAMWLLALGFLSLCPFESAGLGWLVEQLVPRSWVWPLYVVAGKAVSVPGLACGMLVAIAITAINLRGVRQAVLFQIVSSAFMLVVIVVLAGVAVARGSVANLAPLVPAQLGGLGVRSVLIAMAGVLPSVPFFMFGFNAVAQAAHKRAAGMNARRLASVVLLPIACATAFYMMVIVATALPQRWEVTASLPFPSASVFSQAFGWSWASGLMYATALLGLVTTLNGCFIAASQLLADAGESGFLPSWFGGVSSRSGTPYSAVAVVGVCTAVGPVVGSGLLQPIVHIGSLSFAAVWLLVSLAALRLRSSSPELPRPFRVRPAFFLTVGAAACVGFVLLLLIPGSGEALRWPIEHGTFAVWLLLGAVVWSVSPKRRCLRSKDATSARPREK